MDVVVSVRGVRLSQAIDSALLTEVDTDENGYAWAAFLVDGIPVAVEDDYLEPMLIFYLDEEYRTRALELIAQLVPSLADRLSPGWTR